MRSFSWVIDEELGGMAFPGLSLFGTEEDALSRDLAFLHSRGVRAIVSLTEQSLDESALRSGGFDHLHLPIPDMTPPTRGDINRFVAFVEASVAAGKPAAAHCAMGIGRTGTMLACYLVKVGHSPHAAIDEVRRRRPGSIETDEQQDAVVHYGQRLAESSGSSGSDNSPGGSANGRQDPGGVL